MEFKDHELNDFIKKAAFMADNSTCLYKVGCVGVLAISPDEAGNIDDKDFRNQNGFVYFKTCNETLKGEMYCQGCDHDGNKVCIRQVENLKGRDFQKVCSIHAETNLIAKCARYGLKTDGMTIFITNTPCYICAKNLIQAGVKSVYYLAEHTDTTGMDLLNKNGVNLEKLQMLSEA